MGEERIVNLSTVNEVLRKHYLPGMNRVLGLRDDYWAWPDWARWLFPISTRIKRWWSHKRWERRMRRDEVGEYRF